MTIENHNLENSASPVSKKARLSTTLDEHITRVDQEARQQATSFTGSVLHPSIISPIHIANLPLSILEHIQQQANTGNIITSLPNHTATISPNALDYHQPILTKPVDSKKSDEKSKGLSQDEKRQRRLLRNRLAAKDCRKKKKEYIQQMEQTIARLEKENEDLINTIVELKSKTSLVESQDNQIIMNSDDNNRFMKQVGELNAKVGNNMK